jgi:nicotinate-nucleotide pyrophosphorylase (carboxylating)
MSTTSKAVTRLIKQALAEDIGSGDITTAAIVSNTAMAEARFYAKANGVLAGIDVCKQVFSVLDPAMQFFSNFTDGAKIVSGDELLRITGKFAALLSGERTALNILQRMSGIATQTRAFVESVKPYKTAILDTRKTAPGMRSLDKYAVQCGGGQNHRHGLFDMALIKENHIAAAGNIGRAVALVKQANKNVPIEVEATNLIEVREALVEKVDYLLLDNMSVKEMREAVRIVDGQVVCEASGNVSLDNVREIAATGVERISVGSLTHSVKALDISMLCQKRIGT